jgi:hypothetical protein
MPEDNHNRFSALSVLAAFTLGLLSMGIIVLVVKNLNTQEPRALAPAFQESEAASEVSDNRSFSRRAQSLQLSPKPTPKPVRKVAATPPPAPAPREEIVPEQAPSSDTAGDTARLPTPAAVTTAVVETVLPNVNPPAGSIIGRAFLDGTPPPEIPIPFDSTCGRLNKGSATTRHFVTSRNGELADVFVVVTDGLSSRTWPKSAKSALVRDINCFFEPYVSGVRVNQEIVLENSDPVLHNAHLMANENKEANYSLLPKHSKSIRLAVPEIFVRLKCDVHPWEFAYIAAVEHPFFAVTDKSGQFMLPPLPPGRYTVSAYHRKAGQISQEVELNENESRSIEFRFQVPSENALISRNTGNRAFH